MSIKQLSPSIFYVGADDTTLDLFEGQYPIPEGVSYNSYVIADEKTAVMDTIDRRKTEEWFANLSDVLKDKTPDYLVVLHLEPDHAANIERFMQIYPTATLVTNAKAAAMIPQFFEHLDLNGRLKIVAEGDGLDLGTHKLVFVMAPMVHWPEVMVAYEPTEKVLFSADGFGRFGALSHQQSWTDEARRYYINIVGKYGAPVQTLLKKASTLDIRRIYPLHGPMLEENLPFYFEKYNIWSSYQPEEKGVLIVSASVYGHTKQAAEYLKQALEARGETNVRVADLSREDVSLTVADAFRYDRIVLASITYDGELFPLMETFLAHLKSKNIQNRTVGLIENGSWAPMAAKKMKESLEGRKNMRFVEPVVTLRSAFKESDRANVEALADALINS